MLCQQRKVKCDRKFLVPTASHSRRRIPERELLDRLQKYKDLLLQNKVKFEPLHKAAVIEKELLHTGGNYDSNDEQSASSEAHFAVVRSELYGFVRHDKFHSDFHASALESGAKHPSASEESELVALETRINKYLRLCDPENPLHFITIWATRTYLAKCRLVEHYSRFRDSLLGQTEAQLSAAIHHALNMLVSDAKS